MTLKKFLHRCQHHLLQVGIGIDQLINTILGGWADETLSSRCWRKRAYPGWKRALHIVDALFFWQEAHCREAYESEWNRNQLPPSLREMRLEKGGSR